MSRRRCFRRYCRFDSVFLPLITERRAAESADRERRGRSRIGRLIGRLGVNARSACDRGPVGGNAHIVNHAARRGGKLAEQRERPRPVIVQLPVEGTAREGGSECRSGRRARAKA